MAEPLNLSVLLNNRVLAIEVTNQTAHALNLWSRSCSWGWSIFSLLLAETEQSGQWHTLTPAPIRWTANYPRVVTLSPQGKTTFELKPGEPVWQGIDAIKRWQDQAFWVRARLCIEQTPEALELDVFIGESQSPPTCSEPPHLWLFGQD